MILVVGGTGQLGGRVVRILRRRDQPVRCLVRAGSDDTDLRSLGAQVVPGDLLQRAGLDSACRGADCVVATATAIARRLAGAREPSIHDVDEVGMAALVDAAERAGVARFVYVSFAGADRAFGSPLDRAKTATERLLRASSMRAVIVRPDAFQEIHLAPLGRFDVQRGRVGVIGRGDTKRRWVSTDDVAALVAAVAVEAEPPKVVEFGGPEALTRNEAIAVAEQATGRAMRVQRMPHAAARIGMRMMTRRNDALSSVFGAGLLQDTVEADWDDVPLRERGINPRSATEFIQRQARARA
jgi:uncharacterized protein YbjT (DUF2867 family)